MEQNILYVCPRNGERRTCEECEAPFPHRREELVSAESRFRPRCETHGVRLVRVR